MGNCFMFVKKSKNEIPTNTIYLNDYSKENSIARSEQLFQDKIQEKICTVYSELENSQKSSFHNKMTISSNSKQLKLSLSNFENDQFIDEIPESLRSPIIKDSIQYFSSNNEEDAIVNFNSNSSNDDNSPIPMIIKKRGAKKGRNICQGSAIELKFSENFVIMDKTKTNEQIQKLSSYLKNHQVFHFLSDTDIGDLIPKMFYCETKANNFVFKQNDSASCFFFIDYGTVEVLIEDSVKKTLTSGQSFGDLALLYNVPRQITVRCAENCGFWALDRSSYRKTIKELAYQKYKENKIYLDIALAFKNLNEEQKDSLVNILIQTVYNPGENIVSEGEQDDKLFIIKEVLIGSVKILKENEEIKILTEGQSFGEQALSYKTKKTCTVQAITRVICLSLGREMVTKVLGDQLEVIIFKNQIQSIFELHPELQKITPIQLEQLIDAMSIKKFEINEIVLGSKLPQNQLIMCLEGSVEQNQEIILTKGQIYGDCYLVQNETQYILQQPITMKTDGIIAFITIQNFLKIIGGTWQAVLLKSMKSHEYSLQQLKEGNLDLYNSKRQNFTDYTLNDFHVIKILGTGQFGIVYLVNHKSNKQLFALKCVNKKASLGKNNFQFTIEIKMQQEKYVLESTEFPFIMNYYQTMKDEKIIYFLLEYIEGMELFDVIREVGILKKQDCQFYVGSLILTLEYLHSVYIIYRDLKPENIMVDHDGYIKLIDMGTAKILSKSQTRTFTIVGTPHYLAPEVITAKGYSFLVDIWSLGVCFYEFVCGAVPFAEDIEDPYKVYEEIIKKAVKFPSFVKDKKLKSIIERMLNKVPEARLGGSYPKLKADQWFKDFDWDGLYNKELACPLIPPNCLSLSEIQSIAKKQMTVQESLESELKFMQNVISKPKDPDWDSIY